MLETIAFVLLATLVVVAAGFVVFHHNVIVSALALAICLVAVAGLFFVLQAQFIGVLQVIVYAGAIMVLILFVLMLLNVDGERTESHAPGFFQRFLGPLAALGFAGLVVSTLIAAADGGAFPASPAGYGTVETLGLTLFDAYFYPFEAISLLLVVAMVGAVLLAKRRL